MKRVIALACAAGCWSCAGPSDSVGDLGKGEAVAETTEARTGLEARPDDLVPTETRFDIAADAHETRPWETRHEEGLGPTCEEGEGCFLDKCVENKECQSGWCVDHMGDAVCSQLCQEECPQGWSCQQVAGTDPDVIYVCVSHFANLCKPCKESQQCMSIGGAENPCLDYGEEGSFCGGPCAMDADCPWGFSCKEAVTVDGIALPQCVNDSGVCPCTAQSAAKGLWTPCKASNEWGECTGKRVCMEEGLAPCDAQFPGPEICNGLDENCDGDTDEPTLVEGDFVNLCDDGNSCTEDKCKGSDGCVATPLHGTECGDANPCTAADHCENGSCVGTPVVCDDSNPCTDDACDGAGGCTFDDNLADCDDGNPCTVADECDGGDCAGVSIPCDCKADSDCLVLDDGDLCNGVLECQTDSIPFKCGLVPGSVIECPEATGQDGICLAAVCNPSSGACSFEPAHEGLACDDGDQCTLGDKCGQGECAGKVATNCNDGNPCTDDTCAPDSGCLHLPNTLPCQDGDQCTLGDHCQDGACTAGTPKSCDDSNPCTDDSCEPLFGCQHQANAGQCDDGNACTSGDTCLQGGCKAGWAISCEDGNLCTDDSCNPLAGCVFSVNTLPCDDGSFCTTGDKCKGGKCQPGTAADCSDGNVCTDDACQPAGGCIHIVNKADCNDGNQCTKEEKCSNGLCLPGEPLSCDDGNLCTTDYCIPAAGCQHTANANPCNDGDACTTGDVCAKEKCVGGEDLLCDDGNPCTDDTCVAAKGCVSTANTAACDDGNACTTGDQCSGGSCKGPLPLPCDDGKVCTVDGCAPATGCTHKAVNPCCGNGLAEPPEQCDDGNQENLDGCSVLCQLPSCDDGLLNGGESDLDCGGPCPGCPAEAECLVDQDCDSLICMDKACQAAACDDKVLNGDETDKDCGGAACPACADGSACQEDEDCESQYCQQWTCQTPSCEDGLLNGSETGIDCGGTTCPKCPAGQPCKTPEDCDSGTCTGGKCKTPTCEDQVQNGAETDQDCGGPGCKKCEDGKKCLVGSDCVTDNCQAGVCKVPLCVDKVKNGDESDVDCGGACKPCTHGKGCAQDSDCVPDGLCVSSKCDVFGSGKDGDLAVAGGTVTICSLATWVEGTKGTNTATINAGAAGFKAGERILLHQTTGAEAGRFEHALITLRSGNKLTLASPLKNTYSCTGGYNHAQAVQLPQFANVTITGAALLTAPAWDGTTGGILAFLAAGQVQITSGTIGMNARGFRASSHGCTYRCANGLSGESASGAVGSVAAPTNNGSGGGGGQQGQDCAAGGGGGYGGIGGTGTNGSKGACHVGDHLGGFGGDMVGNEDATQGILFGGGGGEGGGDEDGGYPGKGGFGGGIIMFWTSKLKVNGGKIQTQGEDGAHGYQGCGSGGGMGGGGGGAGGGILIVAGEAALGDSAISANGGIAGMCGPSNNSYPGGTGAQGRIAVRSTTLTGKTVPDFYPLETWK